ncbi:hypothetical protein JCM3765_005266 [Sporobolomyces pararoseus]
MSYTPTASTSSSSANHPTYNSNSNLSRPKRRLSNATSVAAFDQSDQEDEDDYSKPRSKRNRAGRGTSDRLEENGGFTADSPLNGVAGSGARGANGKVLSEKEKDARRQARMIRNRNAAQASRDRKKEHTLYLERRVAELEAKLNGTNPHPLSISTFTASSSNSNSVSSPSKLARSQRSTSVISTVSSSEATRISDLEEENEVLRTQLHLEQTESARLRARLDSLEHGGSTTTTPLPAYEPTFAFNTANIKPLPQPEELAFVEARERQKRSPPLTITQIPLPSLPLPLDKLGTSSSTPSSSSSTLMNLDSSRLVAREVEFSLPRKLLNSQCRLRRRTTRRRALLSLVPLPSLHLDNLAPPPMWSDWVKSDPDSKEEETTSGLAFVDFDFLNEGPVVASC